MCHVSYKWQPLDSSQLESAPSQGKTSHRLSAQLSTGNAFPRWPCLIFHLVIGCSRTWYSQGVQPGRLLALLCLLAVQEGQVLPSHPETKERVRSFVHWWEKCTEMQPGYRPECRMSTSGLDPAYRGTNSACGSTGIWHSYCLSMPIKCPFSTTGVPAHLCGLSLCHVTSHNWVETQSLQACSFILAHCIEFPAFHRITKVGRDLHDQLVQPPAQHHVIQSKQFPQEPHPEPFQEQWLHQGSRHFPWLGETLKHRQPLFPLCASMVED